MKMRFAVVLAASFLTLISSASADLHEGEVKGVSGKLGASDQKGFSLLLVDLGDPQLIHGVLTIDKRLGPIETASLLVYDSAKKEIAEVAIVPEEIEAGKEDFEFHLSRELLANSFIAVSHRDQNDLYIAKVLLGTFTVLDKARR